VLRTESAESARTVVNDAGGGTSVSVESFGSASASVSVESFGSAIGIVPVCAERGERWSGGAGTDALCLMPPLADVPHQRVLGTRLNGDFMRLW
jgi:hypothetical protein